MKRRTLMKTAVAALTATIMGSVAATAQEDITVRLGFIHNVENADYYIAIENGIFERYGLNVNLLAGGPGTPNSLTELAAGNVQVAMGTWEAFVDAVQKGNDFVWIGTKYQSSPLGVLSLAADPILTAEDMVGATILAQGKPAEASARATLAANGLDADSIEFLPTGFSPEPLLAGDGKGYTAFGTNQPIALEKMGLERDKDFHFRSFDELGLATVSMMFVVQRDYLEANRDKLVDMMAALIEAQEINSQDMSYAARLAAEKFGIDYGLDMEQQTRQNEIQAAFITEGVEDLGGVYGIDTAKIEGPLMDALRLTGRTDLPENILDYVDPSVIADAHAKVNG